MNIPVIVPTSDDVKPCAADPRMFGSSLESDHAQARVHCVGSKRNDIPPCQFIGWCIREREAFQATEYRGGLHGTWHGVLFVKGKVSKGRNRPGRPRKVEAGVA